MNYVKIGNIELNVGRISLTKTEPELSNYISNIENKLGNTGMKIFSLTLLAISTYSLVNINII